MKGEAGEASIIPPVALWAAVCARAARARAGGALHPIATEQEIVAQGDIRFIVRVVTSLTAKQQLASVAGDEPGDPFLPPDPELLVGELSATHRVVLNKFNAVEEHVLLVTRAFEEQESALTLADFDALARALVGIDGVGFYNSGPVAGASQRHKHLQLVPAPLGDGPERTPIEPTLEAIRIEGGVGRSPVLPFRHAFARLPAPADTPAGTTSALQAAFAALARVLELDRRPRPYNLLATRDWLLLVPRSRESFASVPVNALGFAGTLLVRSREDLAFVRRTGPLRVLAEVGETP